MASIATRVYRKDRFADFDDRFIDLLLFVKNVIRALARVCKK